MRFPLRRFRHPCSGILFGLVCLSVSFAYSQSDNPLPNPGFESGMEGWKASQEDAAAGLSQISAEAAHSGSNGLRVTQAIDGPGSWLQSSKAPVDAGKTYHLGFWARCVEESGIGVWINFFDADGRPVATPAPLALQIPGNAKDWMEYSMDVPVPDGAATVTFAIHCYSKHVSLADFDDFSVSTNNSVTTAHTATQAPPITAVATTVAQASVGAEVPLTNPGFESGAEGWKASNEDAAAGLSQVSAEAAHSGSNGLRVTQAIDGPGSWFQSDKNAIDGGKSYQFGFWARCVEPSGVGVWINFFDATGHAVATPAQLAIQVPQGAKEWAPYTQDVLAPDGATSVTFAIHCYSKHVCLADFDDFSVAPISGVAAAVAPVQAKSNVPPLPQPDPARIKEIASYLDATPHGVGPSFDDRAAWTALGTDTTFRGNIITHAERFLNEPIPDVDSLYAQSAQTGDRKADDLISRRRFRLVTFVLAEGMENTGRFLPAIQKEVEAICSESSWILSGHVKFIHWNDLGTAMTAWNLSTVVTMMGNSLPEATRNTVIAEVKKRVIQPYLDQVHGTTSPPEFWRDNPNNWNAVVHGGITGAALALDDSVDERAEIIAAVEKETQFYIKGFPTDGYSSEGMGYWKYGFGHYILLSEAVLAATHGKVNLYAQDNIRLVAQFPRRFEIIPGVYPAYSDSLFAEEPSAWLFHMIDNRYGLGDMTPRTMSLDGMYSSFLYAYGINMAFDSAAPALYTEGAETIRGFHLRDWFEQSQILVARMPLDKNGTNVSLKGGNNGTSHGHNDLGSFVVTVGRQPLFVDPGSTPYNGTTFGPHRYENQVINSYGHSVPKVAGQLQHEGAQFAASVVDKNFSDARDSMTLDLTKAYQVPALVNLTRHLDYTREGRGAVTVIDRCKFSSPQAFGTALVTFGDALEEKPGVWIVSQGGEKARVEINTGGTPFTVTNEVLKDQARAGKVRRLGIDLKSATAESTITIKITPVS